MLKVSGEVDWEETFAVRCECLDTFFNHEFHNLNISMSCSPMERSPQSLRIYIVYFRIEVIYQILDKILTNNFSSRLLFNKCYCEGRNAKVFLRPRHPLPMVRLFNFITKLVVVIVFSKNFLCLFKYFD